MLLVALALLAILDSARCDEGDLCEFTGSRGSIIGDELYFIAGNYTIAQASGSETEPAANLYHIALNSSFPVSANISSSQLQSTPIDRGQLAYSSAVDSDGGDSEGAIWVFSDTIYNFAGGDASTTPTNKISAYDVTTGEWTDVEVSGGDFNFGKRESASFATAPEAGLGFVAGGYQPYMSGMVRFDAKNMTWTNETLGDGSFGVEPPSLWAGAMVYIPAGTEGMLISFGGRNITRILEGESSLDESVEADWLKIYVYDIASHTWWLQSASGDAPENGRISFCTAVSQSPDGSSFHITAYGGWSRKNGRSYEDVHVLAIPAFQWIDATSVSDITNPEKDESKPVGRDALCGACHTFRGSQVIVLGSQVREGKSPMTVGNCTEEYPPVRVLDLSTYEWKNGLDTEANYSVPTVISRELKGDENGNNGIIEPASGFADDTLADLITRRIGDGSSDSISGDDSTTSGGGNTQEKDSDDTNKGAIAGGVVGGVAGLTIIIAAPWLYVRRKRKQRHQQQQPTTEAFGPADDKSKASFVPGIQKNGISELGPTDHPSSERAELPGGTIHHELP